MHELDIIYSSPTDEGTSATFTFQPFQQVVVHQTLGSTSPFPIVAGILSRVGGIFAAIDGLFALIFGRTVMAVIMGEYSRTALHCLALSRQTKTHHCSSTRVTDVLTIWALRHVGARSLQAHDKEELSAVAGGHRGAI